MQVLKEEVKANIYKAAVECFKESGYEKASMREIAKRAGISPGNLYRYYPNKEALYDTIVGPVVEALKKGPPKNHEDMRPLFLDVSFIEQAETIQRVIETKFKHHDAMFILFLRNKGTKYEGIKKIFAETFAEQSSKFLKKEFGDNAVIQTDELYFKASAFGFVEGLMTILEQAEDEKEFIRNMIMYVELNFRTIMRHLYDLRDGKVQFRRIDHEEIYRHFSSHSGRCADSGSESDREP